MADLNEPKKETVRITLPQRPPRRPTAEKEATGIKPPASQLPPPSAPVRPPAPPLARPPAPIPPVGQSPASVSPAASKPVFPAISAPLENPNAGQSSLRKETARIVHSPIKPLEKLSGAQPGRAPSAPFIRTAPPPVANPPSRGLVESVPTQLCWALLGISALSLLIQLWTYFS